MLPIARPAVALVAGRPRACARDACPYDPPRPGLRFAWGAARLAGTGAWLIGCGSDQPDTDAACMLWIKSFHIVFVTSWFAGLFYLPRIFVNLAMVPAGSEAERDRLLLMARKLYRFMTPLAVLALALGLWLWLGYGITGGWMHAKLGLTALLVVYHLWCGRLLARFAQGLNRRGHVYYRWMNELPVLVLVLVVVLVVVKPF
jgi:putative membrane protein